MPVIAQCSPLLPDIRDAIIAPLLAYNDRRGMANEDEEVAYALHDADGAIAGGLLGYWRDRWLFIEAISVREDLRRQGWGRALLTQAESWAREQRAVGLWLDTSDSQAPLFYARLGFREIGRLPAYVPGVDRIWFAKRLTYFP